MALYSFDSDFGEITLLNPTINIHGQVGVMFGEDQNINDFVMPVNLDLPGPSCIPSQFNNVVLPIDWQPTSIEAWAQAQLELHKI